MCSPGCFKGERETVCHEQRHDSLWQKDSEVVPCKQSSLSLSLLPSGKHTNEKAIRKKSNKVPYLTAKRRFFYLMYRRIQMVSCCHVR